MVAANVLDVVVAAAKVLLEDVVVAAPHRLALVGGEGRVVAGGACENLGLAAKPIEAKISSSGEGAGAGAFLGGAVFFLPKLVMPRGMGAGRGADWGAAFKDGPPPPLVGAGVVGILLGVWSKLCAGTFRAGDGFP